jgi:hypothetical protein
MLGVDPAFDWNSKRSARLQIDGAAAVAPSEQNEYNGCSL